MWSIIAGIFGWVFFINCVVPFQDDVLWIAF
jgi:hypothetical protein